MRDELNEDQAEPAILNILVVEDNAGEAKIMARAFAEVAAGHRLTLVRDGHDVPALLDSGHSSPGSPLPDLIFLDIVMPKMNGFETLARLKADRRLSHIPVILFTSSGNESDILKSYQMGAAGYIQKPILYERLIDILQGVLNYWRFNKLPNPALNRLIKKGGDPRVTA